MAIEWIQLLQKTLAVQMMKLTTSKGVPLVEKFLADDVSSLTRERKRVMEIVGKCRRFWEANVHDRGR